LLVKRRGLVAERLKGFSVGAEKRRDDGRDVVGTAATTPLMGTAAAALAALIVEPTRARSAAAADTDSVLAATNDIAHLHDKALSTMRA
jgi:hypothetical protein